ncbi:MAG: NTP transferase domain-containing protein [Candidatus Diapherotrites archaeon]|nr:NTP transferase domain-containing protein [Candidatus Diapherotrites archaeon]
MRQEKGRIENEGGNFGGRKAKGEIAMKAVILAAGQGVRMKPLTDDKPKALVELKGKPLLQHVLESLQKAGVREAVIVIGFTGEEVEKRFGTKFGKMRLS